MSIINANDIRDNIEQYTSNEKVQSFIKSLTNSQIEDYFDGFVDYTGISNIRNNARREGINALERQHKN